MQRLITFGLASYSFFLIKTNISRLPARIPTHFNAAGEVEGWGSPESLWVLLVVQVLTCGLLLAVPFLARHFPGTVHVGFRSLSDFTPAQRERMLPILTDMMMYMSVLVGFLFSILLREMIRASSSPHPRLSLWWPLGLFLAGTAWTLIYYLRRIFAVAIETGSGNLGTI